MVWAKLDDEILDNTKIARAGVLGFALHVAAITWCCRNLTDGFIPRAKARLLLDFSGLVSEIHHGTPPGTPSSKDSFLEAFGELGDVDADLVAEQLIGCGLWDRDESRDGYQLHDFLDFNPSKEEVIAKRDKERKKKEGQRTGGGDTSRTRLSSRPPGTPSGIPSSPVPVPVPVPIKVPSEPDHSTATSVAAPASKRGSRLPPDWTPTEETQAWARSQGVADPCGKMLDEFRDFWVGVPGARGTKLDWDATFRNRVRQVADSPRSSRRPDTRQPLRDPTSATWLKSGGSL